MNTVRKFLFDNCFDQQAKYELEEEAEENQEPPPPTYGEEDLAAARADAFVEGRNAGIAEMQSAIDQRITTLMSDMIAQLQDVGQAQREAALETERRMLALAAAIAKKVVPPVARAHAGDAVETIIRDCLPKLREEPRIVVRVHTTLIEELRERVDALAVKSGFPGNIILLADDELGDADCRVEWADGGAERSEAEIWTMIDTAVNAHLGPAIPAPDGATGEHEEAEPDSEADNLAGQTVDAPEPDEEISNG